MALTRAVSLLGLALIGAGLLGGCSTEEPTLPTLDPSQSVAVPTGIESLGNNLEAKAQALYDCLQDRGLPAAYFPTPDKRPTLVGFDQSVPAYWVFPSGDIQSTEALSDSQYQEAADQYRAEQERERSTSGGRATIVFLFISGIDRTDDWAACLDQSGYDAAAAYKAFEDANDLETLNTIWNQMVIAASNDWARCARDYGINGVVDAQPAANENDLIAVSLPLTLTEEQLRDLLEQCPAFDPDVEAANDEMVRQATTDGQPYVNIIDQLTAQPSITIDSSSLEPGSGTNVAQWDHFDRLMKIIWEAPTAYYNG
ncbi:MAG: hypothetical protein LBK42_13475 [Propionibacteriaceae bacterium]|jgi:hypothetical protein|nr:hypothetical protein [Propionibacteriaceae bacterium]